MMDNIYIAMASVAPKTPTTIQVVYADGVETQVQWKRDPELLSFYVGLELAKALYTAVGKGIIGVGAEFSFITEGRVCEVKLLNR